MYQFNAAMQDLGVVFNPDDHLATCIFRQIIHPKLVLPFDMDGQLVSAIFRRTIGHS